MNCRLHHQQVAPGGFSLVEVTLAVAIAALAIITFLGLLPQGLEISRKTSMMTLNSNILEQVVRDLENTAYNQLPAVGGSTVSRYYDDQGVQVQADSKNISFVAQMDFSGSAALPATESSQPFLRRVVVRIANTSDKNFEFSADRRYTYSTFSHILAKTRSSTSTGTAFK